MSRRNESKLRHASALVVASLAFTSGLAGCGSSAEPTRASGPPVVPVASTTPTAPPRALRDAPLTPTSPSNVLLDPNFMQTSGSPSWGEWIAVDGASNPVAFGSTALGANPLGVASPVATFPAKPVGATGGKAIDFVAPFPGGPGAATASLWVSKNDAAGQPTTIDPASTSLTITVLGLSGFQKSKGVDLVRDEAATTVIAGRTWYYYRADVAEGLELAGFFDIAVDKSPGNYLLTGPEVLPKTLATLPQPMARAFATPTPSRALRPNEVAAIAAYRRLAPPKRVVPRRTREWTREELRRPE